MQETSAKRPGRKYKRWALLTLCFLLGLVILAASVVYVVDPFLHYRRMTIMTPRVESTLQAYYNIGFARNYDYDTLLLGSSMTENTGTTLVEEQFGGTAINLAFSAGTFPIYAEMMKNAFDTREMRRVFIGMDSFALAADPGLVEMDIPMYLYDEDPFNDVYYLLSWDSIERVITLIQYNMEEDTPDDIDLNKLYFWADNVSFNRRRTLLSYPYYDIPMTSEPLTPVGKVAEMQENIDTYLRPFIEAHPETEFCLYFLPYSALQWHSELRLGMLERHMFYRSYFAEQLLPYENVKLFDFQAHRLWVEDLDNYKDMAHYSQYINEEVTLAMAKDEFLVTSLEQVEENSEVIRDIAHSFVPPTEEELQELREMVF